MYRVECPKCLSDLKPLFWYPPVGYDPNMRKLKCSNVKCQWEEHQILGNKEIKKFDKRMGTLLEDNS